MPSYLIQKLKDRLRQAQSESERERIISSSPLVDRHEGQILSEMKDRGNTGCCGAAEAAEAVRTDGQMYD